MNPDDMFKVFASSKLFNKMTTFGRSNIMQINFKKVWQIELWYL